MVSQALEQSYTAESLESYIYLLLNTEMLMRYRLFFFPKEMTIIVHI